MCLTTRRPVRLVGAIELIAALTFSCGSSGGSPPREGKPAAVVSVPALADPLLDPARLPQDFSWRQQVTAQHGSHTLRFEALVEKTGPRLDVLFLTPYGSRALLLRQTGQGVETQYFVSERLPFSARHILADVHRVFLRGFEQGIQVDGQHAHEVDGELFIDTWRSGKLLAREVTTSAGVTSLPLVSARYQPGMVPGTPAATVTVQNRVHGYQIEIRTVAN